MCVKLQNKTPGLEKVPTKGLLLYTENRGGRESTDTPPSPQEHAPRSQKSSKGHCRVREAARSRTPSTRNPEGGGPPSCLASSCREDPTLRKAH